jgi:hypothetical protein
MQLAHVDENENESFLCTRGLSYTNSVFDVIILVLISQQCLWWYDVIELQVLVNIIFLILHV